MFAIGRKCLAYHGPMLYEAKILRVWDSEARTVSMTVDGNVKTMNEEEYGNENDVVPKNVDDGPCYFVHYQGWKSTWDEWIGLDRINEYNDENISLRKKLIEEAKEAKKQQHQEQQRKKKAGITGTSGSGAGHTKKSKPEGGKPIAAPKKSNGPLLNGPSSVGDERRPQNNGPTALTPSTHIPRIVLHIPVKLKSLLVDDWEFVTKDKKICQLPSPTMAVDQVIATYETIRAKELESPALQSQLSEYCAGLKLYFERSLPVLLLYRLERLQYEELLKKEKYQGKPLVTIYGPMHLLRLLSILPELMSTTTMDSQSCQLIVKQTEQFMEWLVLNIDELFDTSNKKEYYVNTSSQYEGVALGM